MQVFTCTCLRQSSQQTLTLPPQNKTVRQLICMHHVELTLMMSRCDISLSLARMLGLCQNVCCSKSTLSGLLSAVVIFTAWQTPSLNSLKSECSCLSGRYTCMHGSIYKCGEMAAYSIFSPNIGWTSVFSLRNTDKHLHSYLHKLTLLQCVGGVLLHHVACHLYHILYVLYLSTDHT